MAIGSKKNEVAVGSIYDFIFSESRKTPDKVRPVKATGIDSTDAYVNAIAATLEDPLMYVNKATEGAIRGAANIDIASIEIGPAPTEKVKFSSGNIKDLLNNDMKFVDNAFSKMEATRKAGRATAFGLGIAGLTSAIMARKSGLDWETQDALAHMGKSSSDPTKNLDTRARSVALAQKHWEKSDFTNISKDVLIQSYGEKQGTEMYKALQEIGGQYRTEKAKGSQGNMASVFDLANDNFLKLYPIFENTELAHKTRDAREAARRARELGDVKGAKAYEAKAEGYQNAQNLVNVFSSEGVKDDFKSKYVFRKQKELEDFRKEIELLRKSRDPASAQKVRDLQKQARSIQGQLRGFKLQDRARALGELETFYGSVQQSWKYVVGGELLPAIISGDFFDSRKNTAFKWQPTSEERFGLGVVGKDGKERFIKIHVAREASKSNPMMQKYYDRMTGIYYWTPGGIVNTLTTGEGFAYQASKQMELLKKKLKGEGLGKDFNFSKLFGKDRDKYLEELRVSLGEEKYAKLLGFLASNEKTLKRFERLQGVAHTFGFIGRTKDKITGFFTGAFANATTGLRTRFAKAFLKNIKGDAAKKLVEKWVAKGGAKILVEGLKVSIKAYLAGLTGGTSAALNFLVDIAADVVISLAGKIAKPVIKVIIMSFFIITVGTIVSTITNSMFVASMLGSYSHVAPHEIVLGDTDYVVDVGGGSPDGPGGEVTPDIDIPVYSGGAYDIFMSIASEFGVSVTLHDCAGSTEGYCGKIAGGWCYAAQGTVFCEMSRIPESSYNTIFRHEMMHFVQEWYFDYETDIKYREWGADYMSNNGGWYCVVVNGASMRATTAAEIFKREGGCTEEDLINLAYRKVDSADPKCAAYFHSRLESAEAGYCD